MKKNGWLSPTFQHIPGPTIWDEPSEDRTMSQQLFFLYLENRSIFIFSWCLANGMARLTEKKAAPSGNPA
ncbi:hypothetical protein [Paenibacillus sp. SAFN-117]|uniref:hypothetical protein n=1 Tax=Paenibacillus sp. SAFN-117 TaxID=3436860 RepID=UPI003F7DE3BE